MAHLRNYVQIEGCRVVSCTEPREATAAAVAAHYGIEKVYPDNLSMLAAEELDGVVASQPFGRHAALLPEIYPRVKHVLTEKPLCIEPGAGERLAGLASENGCTHMVGYHKRSDPATEHAKAVIDELKADGRLGRLTYVRILMPAGDWTANGFTGVIDAGDRPPGGTLEEEVDSGDMDAATREKYIAFVNYYIHQVNLLRHLLGEPYEVTYADPNDVMLAVTTAGGASGCIEMTPYRTTTAWEEGVLVGFEKGYVKLDLPAPLAVHRAGRVEIYEDPGDGAQPVRTEPTMPWVHAMQRQAENFVAVCRGDRPPPCDAAEAVLDLQVAREYIRQRHE